MEAVIERRAFAGAELRVEGGDDEPRLIRGHAAVFNQLSEDLGGFREKIEPGAFAKSLKGDVRALFNHDPSWILGRTKSRTLRLAEDAQGLAVEIRPPDTGQARSVLEGIDRGDVSQMSFSFRTITDEWNQVDGETVRTLREVELFDVSPVTFAAYPQTDVVIAQRSLEAWRAAESNAAGGGSDEENNRRQRRLATLAARVRMAFVP